MAEHDERRRVICRLCGDEQASTRIRAVYVAADHLLDFHRPAVLAAPKRWRAMVSIAQPARGPRRIV